MRALGKVFGTVGGRLEVGGLLRELATTEPASSTASR